MRFLLLLSALLSALTGAQVGARTPQAAVAVGQLATAAVAAPVRSAQAVGRPQSVLPGLAGHAATALPLGWRLAAPTPLYLSRRRE